MSNPYPKALQLARGERRYRRKVASAKQWQTLWQEKVAGQTCRLCFTSLPPLEAHHLVSRAALGDDVAENLVPLCPGCHAAVTTRAPGALRLLSSRLLVSERVYIVGKLGEGGMHRLFGVARWTAAENIAAAERLSAICSMRPFTPAEAEETVNVLLGLAAALDALAADLADLTDSLRLQSEQREHAVGRMRAAEQALHAGQERWGEALGRAEAAEVRVETLTRDAAQTVANYNEMTDWFHAAQSRAEAAEVREAQLREALERIAEPRNWRLGDPSAAEVARGALVVQPPDTREEVTERSGVRPTVERNAEIASHRDVSDPAEGNVLATPTRSVTSPAGGAPGGVAKEGE